MTGKKIGKSYLTIALDALCAKKGKIYPANVSKHNSNCEKQVILLMIPNGEGRHYLAVEKLSALFWGIISEHHGDFYSLNCLYSFAKENKCKSHENVCENKDFCNIVMSSKDTNKTPFIIYGALECLIEKIDGCKNNP